MKIRAGYIQFAPVLGEVKENIERVTALLEKARGTNLVVLPELCSTGYAFLNRKEAKGFSETIPGGITTKTLLRSAGELQMYIVAGVNERDGSRLYNSAVVVGPEGYIGKYRKMHLFNKEKLIYDPGDLGFPVFDAGGIPLGVLICFDWAFPEVWRMLALEGVEVIAHPSNLILKNLAHRVLPIHSLINRVFIISANRIGEERGLKFIGSSMITNPKGRVLRRAPPDHPAIQSVMIDPSEAKNKMVTERNHLFSDRRPEWYRL